MFLIHVLRFMYTRNNIEADLDTEGLDYFPKNFCVKKNSPLKFLLLTTVEKNSFLSLKFS